VYKNYPCDQLKDELTYFLRGFGQIIFQSNALSGAIFLVGIAVNSSAMLIGAVIGALSSHFSARLLRAERQTIAQGIYGYNGALIGLSVMLFYLPGVTIFGLIMFASLASSLLLKLMLQGSRVIPPFTAPFLISVWLLLVVADLLGLAPVESAATLIETNPVIVFLRGSGQMLFQAHWLAGLLFLIGVAVSSKSDACWAMIGVAVSMLLVSALGYPESSATIGFYSFSAALVAVVLANRFSQPLFVVAGVILAVLLTRAFELAQLTALTAPFVLSAWLIITVGRCWRQS
jgi:urea transporter